MVLMTMAGHFKMVARVEAEQVVRDREIHLHRMPWLILAEVVEAAVMVEDLLLEVGLVDQE